MNEDLVPDEDLNHKATSTETEFLELKPYERSMLLSVMEETLVAQKDKIERLKGIVARIKTDNEEYRNVIDQLVQAN